jgi:DNA-binding Lrp family transcriptional regulator
LAKGTSEIEREIRRALEQCTVSTRGLWHEMRHLIETESDRPGHLQQNGRPISDRQLAIKAGCPSKKVARLLQELQDSGLIERSDRYWHSPRLARIAQLRADGARRKAECLARSVVEAKRARRVLRNTKKGVTSTAGNARVTRGVTPDPTPALFPSPGPLSLIPPTTPSEAALRRAAGKPPTGGRGTERKLTDEQVAIRDAFQAWWTEDAYPEQHVGVHYEGFNGADAAAVLKVMRSKRIHWSLEEAKALARVYLRQPEMYGCVGHPLRELGNKLNHYLTQLERAKKGMNGHGARRKPNAEERGEYAEESVDIPEFGACR